MTAADGGPMSDYFALILLSTRGCTLPPSIDELTDELAAAGYTSIRKERLVPGDSVWGVEAGA